MQPWPYTTLPIQSLTFRESRKYTVYNFSTFSLGYPRDPFWVQIYVRGLESYWRETWLLNEFKISTYIFQDEIYMTKINAFSFTNIQTHIYENFLTNCCNAYCELHDSWVFWRICRHKAAYIGLTLMLLDHDRKHV